MGYQFNPYFQKAQFLKLGCTNIYHHQPSIKIIRVNMAIKKTLILVESEISKLPIRKIGKAPKHEAPTDAFSREAEVTMTIEFLEDRRQGTNLHDLKISLSALIHRLLSETKVYWVNQTILA